MIHRARNVLAKVPAEHQAEVKAAFWAIFDDTGAETGEDAIAVVRGRADRFTAAYAKRFPAAVDCLMTDFASLTTYLRFPAGHHRRIRHSNFIERTFGETRRRVKVIGRLPGERTCLGLGVGGPRPGQSRLAGRRHDTRRRPPTPRPTPPAVQPDHHRRRPDRTRPNRHSRRLKSPTRTLRTSRFTPHLGRHPSPVRRALADSALLFLGFNVEDLDMRVLLRSLLSGEGGRRLRNYTHVAAQIDLSGSVLSRERARNYLEQYFSLYCEPPIRIYWGTLDDFVADLVDLRSAER